MRNHLLTLAIAVIMCWLLVQATLPKINEMLPQHAAKESAFDRVMRTKTLRCGYVVNSPHTLKDLNTGKLSGIFVDITEELGKRLGVTVSWAEELNWTSYVASLGYGKTDVFCGAGFSLDAEILAAELVGPTFYVPITLWAKYNDARFDHNLEIINADNVTISALDGSAASVISAKLFPKAKILGAPPNTDYTFNPLNVAAGKADITILEREIAFEYLKANPNTIKEVLGSEAFKIYPVVMLVNKGEYKLQSTLSNMIRIMNMDGTIDQILKKYEAQPFAYYRVAKPYQRPETK